MSDRNGPVDVEAVGSLPAGDPLRQAFADRARGDEELREAWDHAADEEDELREALADVAIPAGLLERLDAVPAGSPATLDRFVRGFVWLAAAAVFALLVVQPWPKPAPESSEVAAVVLETTAPDPVPASDTQGPKILAVKFWHRTCPACKQLDPVYAGVVERLETEPVLWVTFDMSTEFTRDQSALLASALGIRTLYDDRFGSSGYVVLLDADTLRELGEITYKDAADVMVDRVRSAVAKS